MTTDGERIAYGEGAVWFAFGVADAEADVFNINCGQMPNAMQPGDKGKAKFQLRFNGKTADFEIELSVIAKPTYDIPEPTLTWKELDIVAELTVDTDLKLRGTAKPEVNLTEALAKLGIESMDFVADELENLLYATQYYLTDDVALGGMKSDTLTNTSTAYAPGFWLCAVSDSEGNQTNECCAAPYDGSDHFYVQLFSFNAESGVMSCELGQMANNLKEGQQYYTYLYIVYGNKAISIRYNLNVIESNLGTLEDYEKAGEKTIEVEMAPPHKEELFPEETPTEEPSNEAPSQGKVKKEEPKKPKREKITKVKPPKPQREPKEIRLPNWLKKIGEFQETLFDGMDERSDDSINKE